MGSENKMELTVLCVRTLLENSGDVARPTPPRGGAFALQGAGRRAVAAVCAGAGPGRALLKVRA